MALEDVPQFELEILSVNETITEIEFKHYDMEDDKWHFSNFKKMKLLDDRFKGIY